MCPSLCRAKMEDRMTFLSQLHHHQRRFGDRLPCKPPRSRSHSPVTIVLRFLRVCLQGSHGRSVNHCLRRAIQPNRLWSLLIAGWAKIQTHWRCNNRTPSHLSQHHSQVTQLSRLLKRGLARSSGFAMNQRRSRKQNSAEKCSASLRFFLDDHIYGHSIIRA